MVLERPELHEEKVGTNIFAGGEYEAGLDDTVGCSLAKRANPPLAARQRRRVDLELACLGYVGCCCLERGNVGSMAEFGLQIAPREKGPSLTRHMHAGLGTCPRMPR